MFDSLFKAAAAVITVPVAVAADVVTMGGMLDDHEGTYTGDELAKLLKNLSDATDPEGK